MFGHTLIRIIHQIVRLRLAHPNKIIWICKEDFKSAYRRIHTNADTALKTAVRVKIGKMDLILISLRLVFGGASCPADFSLLSDIVTDAINDLLLCDSWNQRLIHLEFIHKIPKPKSYTNNEEFGKAKE